MAGIMFEINENVRLRIKHVNDRRIIIIDDFYKNPDEIRNLALNSRERNAVKNNLLKQDYLLRQMR